MTGGRRRTTSDTQLNQMLEDVSQRGARRALAQVSTGWILRRRDGRTFHAQYRRVIRIKGEPRQNARAAHPSDRDISECRPEARRKEVEST